MNKLVLTLLVLYTNSFSNVISFLDIDLKKHIIQVGTYSKKTSVNYAIKPISKYDIYILEKLIIVIYFMLSI